MDKNTLVKILITPLVIGSMSTVVYGAQKKDIHQFDAYIESGFGYDDNVFYTPSDPYNDYTNSGGGALIIPDKKSGTFIPLALQADYEYRYKKDIRYLFDAKFDSKYFLDSSLENANEYKTDFRAGVRFRFNKYKKETNHIELRALAGNVYEIYVDYDDGSIKETAGGDQSNRYQYKKVGMELKYQYNFKKIDFLSRFRYEDRDYEDPATWSSLDQKYTRLKFQLKYKLSKNLQLGSYYEYKNRNYDERKSYEIDPDGTINLRKPGVVYSYNDIKFISKYNVNKKYSTGLNYLISSRTDDNQGYSDYLYHNIIWSNFYKINKKLRSSLKLNYYLYDYENAYAYDTNINLDKKESYGFKIDFDAKYKLSPSLSANLNLYYREAKSTDKRYEYEQAIVALDIKYRFNSADIYDKMFGIK